MKMMLQLLRLLALDSSYTLTSLAATLDVSEALLEQMLSDLERGGYVATADLACEGRCAGCPSAGLCALLHGRRIWTVTAKGLQAAA